MKKSTRIIKTIALVLVSLAFLGAAVAKLTGSAMEISLFHSINLDSFRVGIGLIELIIVVTLWFKKTRTISVLLATAVMGGAIPETLSLGAYNQIVFPGIVLLLVWFAFTLDGCTCTCGVCKKCENNIKNSSEKI